MVRSRLIHWLPCASVVRFRSSRFDYVQYFQQNHRGTETAEPVHNQYEIERSQTLFINMPWVSILAEMGQQTVHMTCSYPLKYPFGSLRYFWSSGHIVLFFTTKAGFDRHIVRALSACCLFSKYLILFIWGISPPLSQRYVSISYLYLKLCPTEITEIYEIDDTWSRRRWEGAERVSRELQEDDMRRRPCRKTRRRGPYQISHDTRGYYLINKNIKLKFRNRRRWCLRKSRELGLQFGNWFRSLQINGDMPRLRSSFGKNDVYGAKSTASGRQFLADYEKRHLLPGSSLFWVGNLCEPSVRSVTLWWQSVIIWL